MFDVASEKFALEMLKQYYEDLRSMYNSVLNIFKLSSIGIVISSTIFTLYRVKAVRGEPPEISTGTINIAFIIVILFLVVSAIIVIGQAYRYRITQGMCHLIRSKYNCNLLVPKSLLGHNYWYKEGVSIKRGNVLNDTFLSFMPTLFRHLFIFFCGCCYLLLLGFVLFTNNFGDRTCSKIFFAFVLICSITVFFNKLILVYKDKTKNTLEEVNNNLEIILKSRISKW